MFRIHAGRRLSEIYGSLSALQPRCAPLFLKGQDLIAIVKVLHDRLAVDRVEHVIG